jgi:hypothetical protein
MLHVAAALLLAILPGRAEARQAADLEAQRERPLLAAPGADTIARLGTAVAPEILDERGDWVRVRIEGWVRREATDGYPAGVAAANLGLAAVRADPGRYVDHVVRWRVQHLAMQRADTLRSDMRAGERYLLVRDPGGEAGFAYVVVPDSLAAAAADLAPLQRVEIVGRIRTGRSPLTGHPIVELLELRP